MRHNLMQVLKLIDWNAVDRQHHVAITEAGMLGRRARLHILDKTYELSQLRARVHKTVRLQMKSEIGAVHIWANSTVGVRTLYEDYCSPLVVVVGIRVDALLFEELVHLNDWLGRLDFAQSWRALRRLDAGYWVVQFGVLFKATGTVEVRASRTTEMLLLFLVTNVKFKA